MVRGADDLILGNARLVLTDRVVEAGWLVVRHGRIAAIGSGTAPGSGAAPGSGGVDLQGDYLLPGLVELHTDNLERHIRPRAGVLWPYDLAVRAHDAEMAAAGITTVFNALAIRSTDEDGESLPDQVAAIQALRAEGTARADHYLHMRAEISSPVMQPVMAPLLEQEGVRLISLMDHTPGQRQFADLARARQYYQKKHNVPDSVADDYFRRMEENQRCWAEPNRAFAVAAARRTGAVLASHDDATAEHVAEARAEGVRLAEFPTTLAAAQAARAAGLAILMGAPNVVRGGSHSGNIAARDLARAGLLDILSSDYVPASLMAACFALAPLLGLPAAVALASEGPARAVGMDDRGRLAEGCRADLVRVSYGSPGLVREVWREGARVA
jgi:alpha-D-ribose 1-methylphosphonate 5-triphosphate diphosphatase